MDDGAAHRHVWTTSSRVSTGRSASRYDSGPKSSLLSITYRGPGFRVQQLISTSPFLPLLANDVRAPLGAHPDLVNLAGGDVNTSAGAVRLLLRRRRRRLLLLLWLADVREGNGQLAAHDQVRRRPAVCVWAVVSIAFRGAIGRPSKSVRKAGCGSPRGRVRRDKLAAKTHGPSVQV